jgi:hypothetical protein
MTGVAPRRLLLPLVVAGGLFGLAAIGLGLVLLLGERYSVPSAAMSPTIEPGGSVWTLATGTSEPGRGDIIVFSRPARRRPPKIDASCASLRSEASGSRPRAVAFG